MVIQGFRDRRHGLKKPVVLIIGILLGVACWTGRHYVINGPMFFVRGLWADHSALYSRRTNGLSNRDLITAARNYLGQVQDVDVDGARKSPVDLAAMGLDFNPVWFTKHHPTTVDSNPFAPVTEGNYVVTWFYVPNCQRAIHTVALGPGENWFDIKGAPCYSLYRLSVYMTSDLKLTKVKVLPKAYI